MASRARFVAGGLLGLAVVAALGPAPRLQPVDSAAIAGRVPETAALAAWVAAEEAKHPDVTPGAESTISWAGAEGERTPLSIVYLHGFSATRQEVSPVVENVARELGANVYFPRLTGHGQPGARLGEATATDWLEDTVEAVEVGKALGDRVVLIGTSTGATLAIDRQARAPDPAVMGVVAVSPNFGPKNAAAELLLWPWLSVILPAALGDREWEPRNELQRRYWTTRYPTAAIGPMMAAVDSARRAPLDRFAVPAFFVWSDGDEVVDPARTEEAWNRLPEGFRERETITCGEGEECHVLAGDILAPQRNDVLASWFLERIRRWSER